MTKFNKIAIAVATFMAGSTYAAEADFIQYDIYGQIGGAMETEDAANAPTPNGLIEDDFGLYSDTHVLADIDFKFNKNLSIDTSTLVDFDSEEDPQVTLKELTFNGDFKKFHFKAGRFNNPLYMNHSKDYRDFERVTFRDNSLFSTKGSFLEALDGAMIGYKTKLNKMDSEFNLYAGAPTEIEGDLDYEIVRDQGGDFSIEDHKRESNFNVTVESLLQNKKIGNFRIGLTYLDYEGISLVDSEEGDYNQYLLDIGYKHNIGNLFVSFEFAHSLIDTEDEIDENVDSDQFNTTLAYDYHNVTPYISYTLLDDEMMNDTEDSLELGLNYEINKHFKIKAAYEMISDKDGNDNDIISAGLAIKL